MKIGMDEFDREYLKWKREEDLKGRLSGDWEQKQVIHVSAIKSCPLKIVDWEEVSLLPQVVVGVLLHHAIEGILRRFGCVETERPFKKEVGKYVVVGTPDVVVGRDKIIDIKYTRWADGRKREWDVMQLRLYKWLTGIEKAEVWQVAYNDWRIIEIKEPAYTDEEVVELIENRKCPMWSFECRGCKREDCEYRR